MQLNCWIYFTGFQFSGERTELSRPDGRKTIIETETPTLSQPVGRRNVLVINFILMKCISQVPPALQEGVFTLISVTGREYN